MDDATQALVLLIPLASHRRCLLLLDLTTPDIQLISEDNSSASLLRGLYVLTYNHLPCVRLLLGTKQMCSIPRFSCVECSNSQTHHRVAMLALYVWLYILYFGISFAFICFIPQYAKNQSYFPGVLFIFEIVLIIFAYHLIQYVGK